MAAGCHEVIIPGVHIYRGVISRGEAEALLEQPSPHNDHDDGHSDDGGHGIERVLQERPQSGEQDGSIWISKFTAVKSLVIPWLAMRLTEVLPELCIGELKSAGIDEAMCLYQLSPDGSVVSAHVDTNFHVKYQGLALVSLLIFLTEGYEGGETIFNGDVIAPKLGIGDVLLFLHSIPHEGRAVTVGEKIVLKTDIYFR